jgi:hypothetical protein
MAKQTINLPSITFMSKKDAKAYFQNMLNRYRDKDILSTEDDTILFELLQRHPEAAEKIGVGVKRFYRSRSNIHPTSCFHLERFDGTTTDFSYVSCISGNAATLEQQFYEACRYAVANKLICQKEQLFLEAGGTMKCAKTGTPITIDNAEYRHTEPSFREIVRDFIADNHITIISTMLTHGTDMQYIVKFADLGVESLFKSYHTAKSNLAMFKKYSR